MCLRFLVLKRRALSLFFSTEVKIIGLEWILFYYTPFARSSSLRLLFSEFLLTRARLIAADRTNVPKRSTYRQSRRISRLFLTNCYNNERRARKIPPVKFVKKKKKKKTLYFKLKNFIPRLNILHFFISFLHLVLESFSVSILRENLIFIHHCIYYWWKDRDRSYR